MGEEARVLNEKNFPPLILAAVFSVVVTGCTNQPSRIVYRVPDFSSGKNDLFVIREDGTHDAVLANSGDDQSACGVTTDRRVVFTRQAPTGGRIYIVSEDGSGSSPLRATADDETCFGVTGNDMVIFGINRPPVNLVPNHDLYSISANSSPTATPIALAASSADELPVAISWDNRVIFARREAQVNGHWFSFYSIGNDGANMAPLVGDLRGSWQRDDQPAKAIIGTKSVPALHSPCGRSVLRVHAEWSDLADVAQFRSGRRPGHLQRSDLQHERRRHQRRSY